MSAKRSRSFRAGLEGLERRETPSTHASAAVAKVVSLQSHGTATIFFSEPIQNGQQVTTTLSGSNTSLGKFTTELDVSPEGLVRSIRDEEKAC